MCVTTQKPGSNLGRMYRNSTNRNDEESQQAAVLTRSREVDTE